MICKEVLTYISRIELQTRRILKNSYLSGATRSTTKGTGFDFEQIRDYQVGDDIRFIDWRGSARMQKLLTKEYVEERNRTVILAVDISASSSYSTGCYPKFWHMAQIAGLLAFVAQHNKDKVGLVLFTDSIELFIAPKAGRDQVFYILSKLFLHKALSQKTNFNCLSKHLLNSSYKNAMVFIISDFIAQIEGIQWSALKKWYDVFAIRALDKTEYALDACGFLTIRDIESSVTLNIDARSSHMSRMNDYFEARLQKQRHVLRRAGIDLIDVKNDEKYLLEFVRALHGCMIN